MNRSLSAVLLLLVCAFGVECPAQEDVNKPLSDSDYKAALLQIEKTLPKWESALKAIAPENEPKATYAEGKAISDWRDVGLMEIGNIRIYIAKERVKRTVHGELSLQGFLQSLYDASEEITWREIIGGLTASNLEKYAPELGPLCARIGSDVLKRVALLEKSTCP
jgi:hypothetical protein